MSRSLILSTALACLVLAAGFLLVSEESSAAPPGAPEHAPAPEASRAAEPERVRLVWPTPYPFFKNNVSPAGFLQATVSGKYESGGYGMVRSGGAQFHEGLDLRPVGRDRRGEPTDAVVAAMAGRVAYANPRANGAYGRYVVMEHAVGGVTLYTLYAHLASLAPGLRAGAPLAAGDTIGVMGRSDAAGGFAKDRAHLHFEIGLRLSDKFGRWYAGRRYTTPNLHGEHNGYNLAGIDPLDIFRFARDNAGNPEAGALARRVAAQPVAVLVEAPCAGTPAFVRRNPALVTGRAPAGPVAGWRIGFTAEGAPVRWEPLEKKPSGVRVLMVDAERAVDARRRGLVTAPRGRSSAYGVGSTLQNALELALD